MLIQAALFVTAQELPSSKKSPSVKYVPIKVEGNSITLKNSQIELDKNGFPKQIQTMFNPSLSPIKLLYENIHFHYVRKSDGKNTVLKDGGVQFAKNDKKVDRWNGIVKWKATNRNDSLVMDVTGKLTFNGQLKYKVKITALHHIVFKDVTMHIPFIPTVPVKMLGFGVDDDKRPDKVEWKWDGPFKNQHWAWLGNVDAGFQYTLQKGAWDNNAKGGVSIGIKGSSMLANNYTGEHEMKKGDVLHYDFILLVTPFIAAKKK